MKKNDLLALIDRKADEFTALSDAIWDTPELSLQEFRSTELYLNALREEGFTVEEGVAGIRTAFTGSFGSGRPVIGILGEFDALDGLSQKAGETVHAPIAGQTCGHGCGHNLLGAAAFAAAVAVKEYLREKGSGTVVFFGCPGEEGGAGKSFMARDRIFARLDAALTWHPEDVNEIVTGRCMASLQVEYKFEGVAAHAANCPEAGRSALDAAELMNIGVQFLREHLPRTDMVHYAITDAGGRSPNVVQPEAHVLYMVRSNCVKGTQEVLRRVEKIAKGAALMTETTLSRHFIDGSSDTLPNATLENVLYHNFAAIELPTYTEEEKAFAAALKKTYDTTALPGCVSADHPTVAAFAAEASDGGKKPLNDFLLPLAHDNICRAGSTDVGDVSHLTPTAQIHTACIPSGAPGHSWQIVSAGKSSIAHKGMLLAAKVLAASACDLFDDPALLSAAQAEFRALGGADGYVCPIEDGAVPTIPGENF